MIQIIGKTKKNSERPGKGKYVFFYFEFQSMLQQLQHQYRLMQQHQQQQRALPGSQQVQRPGVPNSQQYPSTLKTVSFLNDRSAQELLLGNIFESLAG